MREFTQRFSKEEKELLDMVATMLSKKYMNELKERMKKGDYISFDKQGNASIKLSSGVIISIDETTASHLIK